MGCLLEKHIINWYFIKYSYEDTLTLDGYLTWCIKCVYHQA